MAQLREQSGFFKWLGCFCGTHCKGLTARIGYLYQEIQTKKELALQRHKAHIQALEYQKKQENYYTDQLQQLSQESFLNGERKQAFEATLATPHHRTIRSFDVDPLVLSHITPYGITAPDVTTIQANPYEYQLHTEFIEQLETLVTCADNGDRLNTHDFLLDALGQSIALGIQANKNQAPLIATRWANFGWQALEIATGIGEGGLLGVYNTAFLVKNTLCHPLDTAYDFLHALRIITTATGKALGMSVELGTLCITGNSAQAYEEAQKIYAATQLVTQECVAKLEAMSHREIAKQTTALATEYMLTSKALTLGHTICARAGPLLADFIEALRTEQALEYAIIGAEGTAHYLSEVAKHSGGDGIIIGFVKDGDRWVSKAGLVYGPDKKFGSRVNHILQHMKPNPSKLNHTVFAISEDMLFDLIDFAWTKRGAPIPNDPGVFVIKLDEIIIGTLGERAIKIVTVPGTSNIITAYPIEV